jgi:hypothetical protein
MVTFLERKNVIVTWISQQGLIQTSLYIPATDVINIYLFDFLSTCTWRNKKAEFIGHVSWLF